MGGRMSSGRAAAKALHAQCSGLTVTMSIPCSAAPTDRRLVADRFSEWMPASASICGIDRAPAAPAG